MCPWAANKAYEVIKHFNKQENALQISIIDKKPWTEHYKNVWHNPDLREL
jgi:hypothetical protein